MILVTGATGQLGGATIEHLLKNTDAKTIVALARDDNKAAFLKERGVAVRIGDFDDTDSLHIAMQGIDKVLLVSTVDANRLQQHKNVVDAAKKTGVQHIVYTGISMQDVGTSAIESLMASHFQTEDYIRESGLTYTFLRNTLYLDGIPFFTGEQVFDTGISLPAGEGKVPYALRREMGEAAANVLLQQGHENKTYDITGGELYSYADVARELSVLSGKIIGYSEADASSFQEQLKAAGTPDFVTFLVAGFSEDTKNGQFEQLSTDLENLIGRKPTALTEGLKEVYKL